MAKKQTKKKKMSEIGETPQEKKYIPYAFENYPITDTISLSEQYNLSENEFADALKTAKEVAADPTKTSVIQLTIEQPPIESVEIKGKKGVFTGTQAFPYSAKINEKNVSLKELEYYDKLSQHPEVQNIISNRYRKQIDISEVVSKYSPIEMPTEDNIKARKYGIEPEEYESTLQRVKDIILNNELATLQLRTTEKGDLYYYDINTKRVSSSEIEDIQRLLNHPEIVKLSLRRVRAMRDDIFSKKEKQLEKPLSEEDDFKASLSDESSLNEQKIEPRILTNAEKKEQELLEKEKDALFEYYPIMETPTPKNYKFLCKEVHSSAIESSIAAESISANVIGRYMDSDSYINAVNELKSQGIKEPTADMIRVLFEKSRRLEKARILLDSLTNERNIAGNNKENEDKLQLYDEQIDCVNAEIKRMESVLNSKALDIYGNKTPTLNEINSEELAIAKGAIKEFNKKYASKGVIIPLKLVHRDDYCTETSYFLTNYKKKKMRVSTEIKGTINSYVEEIDQFAKRGGITKEDIMNDMNSIKKLNLSPLEEERIYAIVNDVKEYDALVAKDSDKTSLNIMTDDMHRLIDEHFNTTSELTHTISKMALFCNEGLISEDPKKKIIISKTGLDKFQAGIHTYQKKRDEVSLPRKGYYRKGFASPKVLSLSLKGLNKSERDEILKIGRIKRELDAKARLYDDKMRLKAYFKDNLLGKSVDNNTVKDISMFMVTSEIKNLEDRMKRIDEIENEIERNNEMERLKSRKNEIFSMYQKVILPNIKKVLIDERDGNKIPSNFEDVEMEMIMDYIIGIKNRAISESKFETFLNEKFAEMAKTRKKKEEKTFEKLKKEIMTEKGISEVDADIIAQEKLREMEEEKKSIDEYQKMAKKEIKTLKKYRGVLDRFKTIEKKNQISVLGSALKLEDFDDLPFIDYINEMGSTDIKEKLNKCQENVFYTRKGKKGDIKILSKPCKDFIENIDDELTLLDELIEERKELADIEEKKKVLKEPKNEKPKKIIKL